MTDARDTVPSNSPSKTLPDGECDSRVRANDDPFPTAAPTAPLPPRPCVYPPVRRPDMCEAAPVGANNSSSITHCPTDTPRGSASVTSSIGHTSITSMSSMERNKVHVVAELPAQRHSRDSKQSRASKHSWAGKRSRGCRRHSRAAELQQHARPHPQTQRIIDPEKAVSPTTPVDLTFTYDDDDDEQEEARNHHGRRRQEDHAVKILLFMSGPCLFISLINAAWAWIALLVTALAQPVRMCSRRPTFGQQLGGLLGPSLNLHLRCIYTPLPPHADEDASYHDIWLLLVHLLSPPLSLGVVFASWVLAAYWLCSGAIGDPAGQDKRDDGREAVLGLRMWWERWLRKAVRDDSL